MRKAPITAKRNFHQILVYETKQAYFLGFPRGKGQYAAFDYALMADADPYPEHPRATEAGARLCIQCARRFVDLIETEECFAAFPGALDFEPLAPEISARWLSKTCPGRKIRADVDAYANRPHNPRSLKS